MGSYNISCIGDMIILETGIPRGVFIFISILVYVSLMYRMWLSYKNTRKQPASFVYRLDKVLKSIEKSLEDTEDDEYTIMPTTKDTDMMWAQYISYPWYKTRHNERMCRSLGWTLEDLANSSCTVQLTESERIISITSPDTSVEWDGTTGFMMLRDALRWIPRDRRSDIIHEMISNWGSNLGVYEHETAIKRFDGIRWIHIFMDTTERKPGERNFYKCGFHLVLKHSFLKCKGELLEKARMTSFEENNCP